jgi:hypothetical protein
MDTSKDREALSGDARLVLATLESINRGHPLSISVEIDRAHPDKISRALNELAHQGFLITLDANFFSAEYNFEE